ncbi:hypothetical protein FA95DRAFT_768658 [Auriscalpium vulgare]|uniref:Uncharacterized protein n=1 Tax=Auriscalpium vulgare TaxID=40419 RepID=A0ACB8RAI0_9AGAM|nr:hypothetical protein FA95DRAFT_768658 [Auriscalpium vulgare]
MRPSVHHLLRPAAASMIHGPSSCYVADGPRVPRSSGWRGVAVSGSLRRRLAAWTIYVRLPSSHSHSIVLNLARLHRATNLSGIFANVLSTTAALAFFSPTLKRIQPKPLAPLMPPHPNTPSQQPVSARPSRTRSRRPRSSARTVRTAHTATRTACTQHTERATGPSCSRSTACASARARAGRSAWYSSRASTAYARGTHRPRRGKGDAFYQLQDALGAQSMPPRSSCSPWHLMSRSLRPHPSSTFNRRQEAAHMARTTRPRSLASPLCGRRWRRGRRRWAGPPHLLAPPTLFLPPPVTVCEAALGPVRVDEAFAKAALLALGLSWRLPPFSALSLLRVELRGLRHAVPLAGSTWTTRSRRQRCSRCCPASAPAANELLYFVHDTYARGGRRVH